MAQNGGIHGPIRPYSGEIRGANMETAGGDRSKGCKSSVERKSPLPPYLPRLRVISTNPT